MIREGREGLGHLWRSPAQVTKRGRRRSSNRSGWVPAIDYVNSIGKERIAGTSMAS